MANVVT